MIHRSLVLRERITAIVGAALLLLLVGASYYYSVQTRIEALKYVPSETSPDFTARRVTLTDFDERGVATARLSASTMEHFSDERMRATDASYHSLDPAKPQLALTGDRAWSNDSLETVELEGNVQLSRAPFKDEPDLFFTTEYIKGYLDTYRFGQEGLHAPRHRHHRSLQRHEVRQHPAHGRARRQRRLGLPSQRAVH